MDSIKKINPIVLPILLSILIFFLPFFWFKPGEMDLGGDSSRLYFYDPISYLTSHTLYGISASSLGAENISYYGLPFIITLVILRSIIQSPTVLIAAFHGLSFVVAFLSIYGIVQAIVAISKITTKKHFIQISSALAGVLYIFSPSLIDGWDKVILTHSQFFLNPLLFYLFLRFFITNRFSYLLVGVLITFIFSPNFSYPSAPPFFSFYPIMIFFLLLYSHIIIKKRFSFVKLLLAFGLFVFIQAFHLLPQIMTLLDTTSANNKAVFSEEAKFSRGLQYFVSVAASIKVSNNIQLLQQGSIKFFTNLFSIIFPLIIVLAFILKKNRTLLLVGIFFLITLFFTSANITNVGFLLYKSLFSIPGFSMFRNYYGQWVFTFTFYYVLLFGIALTIILQRLKSQHVIVVIILISLIIVANSYQLITGELVNKELWQTEGKKMFVTQDPDFFHAIDYIKKLPIDGKVMTVPMTDPGYEMFRGENNGIYQGPSVVSYLAGKKDFAGVQELDPYTEFFLMNVHSKNYVEMRKIMSLLNIKYIFYNADPQIYDSFPDFPYSFAKIYFPKKQHEYMQFINGFHARQIGKFGNYYSVLSLDDDQYLPHIYAATKSIFTNDPIQATAFIKTDDPRIGMLSIDDGGKLKKRQDILIKLKNQSPLTELFNNFHLHTHDPFISKDLNDKIYGFVVLKEDNDLKKSKTNLDDYLTVTLFLATKRIAELEHYGNTMQVLYATWEEPAMPVFGSYNSWEASLQRYNSQMQSLIRYINTSKVPNYIQLKNRIVIDEQLTKHEQKLTQAINNSAKSSAEKEYLLTKSRLIFESLYKLTNKPTISPETVMYVADIPNIPSVLYYAYIKKGEVTEGTSMDFMGKSYRPLEITEDYVIFGPFNLSDKNDQLDLHLNLINVLDTTRGPVVTDEKDAKKLTASSQTFTFNNETNTYFDGATRTISAWKPNTQYVITFDYKTYGDDFLFKFYEKRKEGENKISISPYFEKILRSNFWVTHQTILTSDKDGTTGYIQFLSNNNNEKGKIDIRNLTVSRVESPTIFLRQSPDENSIGQNVIPTISFTKLNPTQYKVHIANFTNKFTLVFSEAFNSRWKVYKDKDQKNEDIVASYFNNTLRQGKTKRVFIEGGEPSIFFDENPLPENKHFIANGYANGWVLDPSDFSDKTEVSLRLDFGTQKIFLIGLAISLIAFTLTIILLIFQLFYERKHKK